MRVISGKHRGKRLAPPADDKIRPTTDKIKETIFNVLQGEIEGARVLDLFAGSGALGIECLSRGAQEAVFADKNRLSLALVRENLKGIDGKYRIIAGDFLLTLRSLRDKFDLIFLDPPYDGEIGGIALNKICALDILSKSGIIIYEHGSDRGIALEDARYKTRTKKMGSVTVDFISRKSVALVTGSFDPITNGHLALIDEALKRYDEVKVACLINDAKTYTFTPEQRLGFVNAAISGRERVSAFYSDKLAVEAAKDACAAVLVRGIRGEADREYEEQMAAYNREHGFETEFIELDSVKDVSSTEVKAQIKRGDFSNVPEAVADMLKSLK